MAILVNVPFIKPHKQFLPHFVEWYAANKARHDLRLHWICWKALHQVQALAVQAARTLKATHLLFTEDDHWGFPVDGLQALLDADEDVIGFPTYSRKFPYLPFNMRRKDPSLSLISKHRNLHGFYQGTGPLIQDTDLISWAFTLVKTNVFDRIQDPFEVWGICPTDSYFCQYCLEAGIVPKVHFGYTMPHGDFGPDEVVPQRRMRESVLMQQRQALAPLLIHDDHDDFIHVPEALQAIETLQYAELA